MKRYNPSEIEPKWQKIWSDSGIYAAEDFSDKPKYTVLTEFPYPSGAAMHMGHAMTFTGGDIVARYKRAKGYNVLFPMGFDAFGLPAENFAIKNKVTPQAAVEKNVAHFRKQLDQCGYSFDWNRSFSTTDPEYYRWTQWLFLQFFKKGLAYQDEIDINWCPFCKTGLANEEVEGGRHERCDNLVEKKKLKQWMLKITDYAERLIDGLADVDYPSMVADQQINWIGRSVGAEIDFEIDDVPYFTSEMNPLQPDKEFTKRKEILAFVYDPKTDKYLFLKYKNFPWTSVVVGGVENDEDVVTAARREVLEETGYKNLKFERVLGKFRSEFYAANKGVNRDVDGTQVLFTLENNDCAKVSEDEKAIHDPIWLAVSELKRECMPNYDEIMLGLARIDGQVADKITVFTTRPDTIFGATFMVLAPEHPLISKITTSDQKADVESYIKTAAAKSEIERQDTNREKTGTFTGAYAINPANGEKIPIWIADFVLAQYGTGAVFGDAHDERDYEFAKKFDIPLKQTVAPSFGEKYDGETKKVSGVAVVGYNPKTAKYLAMRTSKGNSKYRLPCGGIMENETYEECALRELAEETGYHTDKIIPITGWLVSHFYNSIKKVHCDSVSQNFLAIIDDASSADSGAREEHEKDFTNEWLDFNELRTEIEKHSPDNDHWLYTLERAKRTIENNLVSIEEAFTDEGVMVDSGQFDGLSSAKARGEIIKWLAEKDAAREKIQYKLRDWVYSRQRYWGEPIPIIHCDKCGAVAVPDDQLPVELPIVDHYEPTDDGRSPLSKIESWVNTTCPKCGAPAKRETDTMPNWAGSNWYYLRYFDAHNNAVFADSKKLEYWGMVDMYLGGMEHTTLHLLYSRFHHQFMYDQGLVPTPEPYAARRGHGMLLAADGTKMSKSKGNVVDPAEVIDSGYGADALRLATVFLAPYEQTTPWSPETVAGTYRFLGRGWKLVQEHMNPSPLSSKEVRD
ncbi:class I tRNA ligase family protein, partial [Candidatus Saccharibacteria bacterium]|nr:class I tRNA ligase family protein [Candidatus Saccharibacteria bacterium]